MPLRSAAIAKGGTLFVEHANRSFAKENKGQNAYITALDLDGGAVAWRSPPLVANAETFVLAGGAIVCQVTKSNVGLIARMR